MGAHEAYLFARFALYFANWLAGLFGCFINVLLACILAWLACLLVSLACLPARSFAKHTAVCFALLGLRRLRMARSLAKLASVKWTMLGLLDLRRLRLAHSLAELASLTRPNLYGFGAYSRSLAFSS